MQPRAITGLGIVSTIGVGREAFMRALHAPAPAPPPDGGRAEAKVESFDAAAYPGARILEVRGFDASRYLGDKGLRTLDRLTKLLIVAARLAMHDAGFKKDGAYVVSSPEHVGLVCSNAYGSLEAITELDRVAVLEDARYINPAKFPNTVSNSAAGYVSIWEDLRAMNVSVSDGNCGALDAVACADVFLETKRADALLVGGAEAMSEALYLAFHRLGALQETRPAAEGSHSAGRLGAGAVIGEGAALLVTEAVELAKARGASILAEVFGYGTAFVPPENEGLLIHPSAEAMERAIVEALADAGVRPGEIDIVASGVSGLAPFDQAELSAITRTLGQDARIAAPKELLGETLGAGGAMAMAASLAWLEGAPPAALVRGYGGKTSSAAQGASGAINTVLVTSMGYYGNASAVVMRKSA